MADYADREYREEVQSVIKNCYFAMGVCVRERSDGRAEIYVGEQLITPSYDGPALREFMEKTAKAWLGQLAGMEARDG